MDHIQVQVLGNEINGLWTANFIDSQNLSRKICDIYIT